jgi:hypothetical protein
MVGDRLFSLDAIVTAVGMVNELAALCLTIHESEISLRPCWWCWARCWQLRANGQ